MNYISPFYFLPIFGFTDPAAFMASGFVGLQPSFAQNAALEKARRIAAYVETLPRTVTWG